MFAKQSFIAGAVGRLEAASTALERAELAQSAAEALGQPTGRLRVSVLEARSALAMRHGDLDDAADAMEKMRTTCRELGNFTGEVGAALNLADFEVGRGNTLRAVSLAREYLPRAHRLPRQDLHAGVLRSLAGTLAAIDDIPGSKQMAREAVALLVQLDRHPAFIATAIEHLALALLLEGESERPARLAGYCEATIRGSSRERGYTEQVARDRLMRLLGERFRAEDLERLVADGALLSPAAAVKEALQIR